MRSVLYLNLGELLNCAGKPKEALSAYNKAELLFREEHTDFGLAVVYFAKGELFSRTGKPKEAFSAYNKAEILFKKDEVINTRMVYDQIIYLQKVFELISKNNMKTEK